ncbi:MAG: bacterioferritin [Terracidiphilus sp.]
MKGNEKVLAELNKALHEELSALSQYFIHAEMCESWKYDKLFKAIRKLSIVEMKHAEKLIERILFLGGAPNLAYPVQLKIGKTVKEQLAHDLEAELGAIRTYNEAVALARAEGDNGTADLFAANLKDEEEHADWIEGQLNLVREVGYESYLSEQMKAE